MRRLLLLLGILLATTSLTGRAQTTSHTWEVYLMRGVTADGLDRLKFIDIFTGDTRTTEVSGERYTIVGDSVMFYDYENSRVMLVGVDGVPRVHPYIQVVGATRRVDWVVSEDGRMIAWTETQGTPEALRTVTTIATIEGANRREILRDGPREAIRAMPVAFTGDQTSLIMDAQPDGISQFSAYLQYAGLFSVNLETSAITTLPGEPDCFCGAGVFGDLFLRLSLTDDLRGFDVVVHELTRGATNVVAAETPLDNVTQAGDILIAPDGNLAVYAMSNVSNFGTPSQSVRTVFMLVDLRTMTQRALTGAITTYVHPVHWTEDSTAIVFTSPQVNGTWKISLSDGELRKVALESTIGTLTALSSP